jgi:hypothetical protein
MCPRYRVGVSLDVVVESCTMMVTTHHPIFLPWPGFFYKALCADTMVLLDAVQFPLGRSWMTRNRLKSDQGELWLRVPVWKAGKGKQIIRDVAICDDRNWRRKHLYSLREQYAHAPYQDDYLPTLEAIYSRHYDRLVDLNLELIRFLWDVLGLQSRLLLQSEIGVSGMGTELLVSICRALDADTYVTLPFVKKHLEPALFPARDIMVRLVRFYPPIYPQLWDAFRYNLSAMDLLFNCGPKSLDIIARAGEG